MRSITFCYLDCRVLFAQNQSKRSRDDAIGVEIGRGFRVRILRILGFQSWIFGFSGAVAMLRHFVRAGIRHSRHPTCLEGYLPRIVLNGGHSYASSSRSPKRLGEKRMSKGKGGEASIRQHRLASEVKSIVSSALQQGPYDSALLRRCGFEIEEVKMSGDLRKAFVLWKAMPGMHQTVEKELNAQGKRLRSLVFEQLSMPFSPAIQFRQDKVNPQAQAIDDVLSKLDEESD